jgi:hypothetical protein
MLETLLLALVSLAPLDASLTSATLASALKWTSAPNYQSAERAVDNWRFESALNLDLSPLPALAVAFGRDLPPTPRCVKLNNYWCVKRAGWNGEIAADADGHVAFASALEGAAVAALLLRHYYVEFGRHSARAIVTRWAPAQCVLIASVARAASAGAPASRANLARMLPQRVVPAGLAPHGIQNTLRARWLAAHGRSGGVALRTARKPRRRTQPPAFLAGASVNDLIPAPAIAVGMGEIPINKAKGKFAKRTDETPPRNPIAPARPNADKPAPDVLPPAPVLSCASEMTRISNYAARVAAGVAKDADGDLGLFSADGTPTENLAKVMANMAAVEIGPLRASNALINLAVAQLRVSSKSDSASR